MNLTLSVINGFEMGKTKSFTTFPISIGRLPDNEFQINDSCVSRRHCTIFKDDVVFMISDLKSTNGTYLNKTKLDQPIAITDGDSLILGETLLIVKVEDKDI